MHTKKCDRVVRTFLTEMHQKFESTIIYCFNKSSQITAKFKYVLRLEILFHMLNIIILPCINFNGIHEKFDCIIIFFFYKMFESPTKFGYFSKISRIIYAFKKRCLKVTLNLNILIMCTRLLYTLNLDYHTHIFTSKVWIHWDLPFSEDIPKRNTIWIFFKVV